MPFVYHVAPHGSDAAPGTAQEPFRTISHAAQLAQPGDTVQVHSGIYREWVRPARGGLNNAARITYEAAPGEHPVITGAEVVKGWQPVDGTVWSIRLPNTMFGSWNPFAQPVAGDWLLDPTDPPVHTGDVYLNGRSMYEAFSLEEVQEARRRESGHQLPWSDHMEPILDPEDTVYQWHAQVEETETLLYANFQGHDPNAETVEINVRPYCFYPEQTGVNYLTLRGFEICRAACPWAPPTADQPGMVGTHWSTGWIIENNDLHDAKCSALSLGKEISTGHNFYSRFGRKPGYQYQMEAVFLGLKAGWCRERVGSHLVRNNTIHDCGQNGIVGHMGAAFSRIEHNQIYRIGTKREYFGHEIGGIKLHAAVDTVIQGNNIHHCSLGTWLDWQAQGARVTRNVYHHNDRDFMIEVTHGPCLVDGNIFASPYTFDNMAQGTAFVHNLICGWMRRHAVLDRATPYHFPHSTDVAGCAVVYGGDDRLYNNLFTGEYRPGREDLISGGVIYDSQTTAEEYPRLLDAEGNTDEAKYYKIPQPVYAGGNVYAGCALPFRGEAAVTAQEISAQVLEQDGCTLLELTLPQDAAQWRCEAVSTHTLGAPRITEEAYEHPDGTAIDFGTTLMGDARTTAVPGPLAQLTGGTQRIVVWQP